MLTITATTTDHSIAAYNKSELVESLNHLYASRGWCQPCFRRMKKDEVIAHAIEKRDRLAQEEAARQLEEEYNRRATMDWERGVVAPVYDAMDEKLRELIADRTNEITEFQTKISGCVCNVAYYLRDADDILFASELLGHLTRLRKWVQHWRKTKTFHEVVERFNELLEEETRRLFEDDSYRHNSSAALGNVDNISKYKAFQSYCRLLRSLTKELNRDNDDDDLAQRIRYAYAR